MPHHCILHRLGVTCLSCMLPHYPELRMTRHCCCCNKTQAKAIHWLHPGMISKPARSCEAPGSQDLAYGLAAKSLFASGHRGRYSCDNTACSCSCRQGPDTDQWMPKYHKDQQRWSYPFIMSYVNGRVVRRSASLQRHIYGAQPLALQHQQSCSCIVLSSQVGAGLRHQLLLSCLLLSLARGAMCLAGHMSFRACHLAPQQLNLPRPCHAQP